MPSLQLLNITRAVDAVKINEVLNHPEVRPFVADMADGNLDISEAVLNQHNVLLMGEFGGVMFYHVMPGLYEAHTQVLPEGRGDWAAQLVTACAHWMFTRTDATEIITRVPSNHPAAAALTRVTGMTYEFTEKKNTTFNGEVVDVNIYSGRIQEWIKRANHLDAIGSAFHQHLNDEAKRLGVTEQPHEDDETHNRYVGASVAMMQGGQIKKAVLFYNRWAHAARHPVVTLVGLMPAAIQFDLGIMLIRGTTIESIEVIL